MSKYLISRRLNYFRWSTDPAADRITQKVIDNIIKYGTTYRFNDSMSTTCSMLQTDKQFRQQLTVLLLDLFVCSQDGTEQWISVSMSNRGYQGFSGSNTKGKRKLLGKRNRYNPSSIDRKIIRLIHVLRATYLIEFKSGFLDRSSKKAFRSRIRPSRRLIDIFKSSELCVYSIKTHPDTELLELRDKNGDLQNYQKASEPVWAENSRELLRKYNHLLQKSIIDVPEIEKSIITSTHKGEITDISIAPNCPFVKRVFNNGRWDHSAWSPFRRTERPLGAPCA